MHAVEEVEELILEQISGSHPKAKQNQIGNSISNQSLMNCN